MSVRVWKLDRPAVEGALESWARGLAADASVHAVILFGSLARGDATAASDADVLILLADSALVFEDRIARYKPVGLGIPVDVFPYTFAESRRALAEGWGPLRTALDEGTVLFQRADWRAQLT